MLTLTDAYAMELEAYKLLYELLSERTAAESISHKRMPTWAEHVAFVHSHPYREWWLVFSTEATNGTGFVGAIYLSKANEVGVGILRSERRRGYASEALKILLGMHRDERMLANIAPGNMKSVTLFQKAGFKGPIQLTYELTP